MQLKPAINVSSSTNFSTEIVLNIDDLLRVSLDARFDRLSQQLEWTELAVKYQSYIDLLAFTLEEQVRVANGTQEEKEAWAREVLTPGNLNGLDFWLDQYDMMMKGEGHLRPEKPLLQLYMETRWQGACDESYVEDVEALWVLTQVTQVRGHLAMLNAQDILAEDVSVVKQDAKKLMQDRVSGQQKMSGEITCPRFQVQNTLSLQVCEENHLGFGLIPVDAVIPLECNSEFYPTTTTVSCPAEGASQTAKCEACNCDPTGSVNQECQALTGKCACKPGFYGDKCNSRDCVGNWNPWSACGCGNSQTRSRTWQITTPQYGGGKHCTETTQTEGCFSTCCGDQFYCGGNYCIHSSQQCDYK